MSVGDYLAFGSDGEVRLLLSRRLRDVLVDEMLLDGATQAQVEEDMPSLTEVSARLVDALCLVVERDGDGTVLRVTR